MQPIDCVALTSLGTRPSIALSQGAWLRPRTRRFLKDHFLRYCPLVAVDSIGGKRRMRRSAKGWMDRLFAAMR